MLVSLMIVLLLWWGGCCGFVVCYLNSVFCSCFVCCLAAFFGGWIFLVNFAMAACLGGCCGVGIFFVWMRAGCLVWWLVFVWFLWRV